MRRLLEAYQMAYDEICVTDENRLNIMEREKKAREDRIAEGVDEMLEMRKRMDEMTTQFSTVVTMLKLHGTKPTD